MKKFVLHCVLLFQNRKNNINMIDMCLAGSVKT